MSLKNNNISDYREKEVEIELVDGTIVKCVPNQLSYDYDTFDYYEVELLPDYTYEEVYIPDIVRITLID